jgi:hypothetical protein
MLPPSTRVLATDREPEPRPPYLRVIVVSACWKAWKIFLLLGADADAGIGDGEGDRRRGAARDRSAP